MFMVCEKRFGFHSTFELVTVSQSRFSNACVYKIQGYFWKKAEMSIFSEMLVWKSYSLRSVIDDQSYQAQI